MKEDEEERLEYEEEGLDFDKLKPDEDELLLLKEEAELEPVTFETDELALLFMLDGTLVVLREEFE